MGKRTKKAPASSERPNISALFHGAGNLDERVTQALDSTSGDSKEILLDLCSWVAHLQENNEVWKALKRNVPEPLAENPNPPSAAKRKAAVDAGITQKKKKAKTGIWSAEKLRFANQYFQGREIPHSEGSFCGQCVLITGNLSFVSPLEGDMHLEVQNGIRIAESHADVVSSYVFLVFFHHIAFVEAVFIRPNPQKSAPKREAMQFVIIPTAMVGASSVRRDLPLPIIFNTPETKPKGQITEFGDADSHASLIENVLRKELASFKAIIEHLPVSNRRSNNGHALEAAWHNSSQFDENSETRKQRVQGLIYLLDLGLLFLSKEDHKTIYLPWRSIKVLIILSIKDLASNQRLRKNTKKIRLVEINLIVEATEPWYDADDKGAEHDKKEKDSGKESHQINFSGIAIDSLQALKDYSEVHKHKSQLDCKLCEMTYSDYNAGELVDGMQDLREEW